MVFSYLPIVMGEGSKLHKFSAGFPRGCANYTSRSHNGSGVPWGPTLTEEKWLLHNLYGRTRGIIHVLTDKRGSLRGPIVYARCLGTRSATQHARTGPSGRVLLTVFRTATSTCTHDLLYMLRRRTKLAAMFNTSAALAATQLIDEVHVNTRQGLWFRQRLQK